MQPALSACLNLILILVLVAVGTSSILTGQSAQNFDNVQIKVLPVQGNVYMVAGAGGNITLQVGKEGVLMVDTEYGPLAPRIMAEVRKLSKGPIRYIINTDAHPDHVGGNAALANLTPEDPATSDVISAGDIFTPGAYPFIDLERGGSVEGEIAALNHILALTVPGHTQDAGTYVVPGHGRICDEADVVEYRDMVVIVRDRVREMIKKGMSLEQVKAARLTRDYDTEYISSNSFVTADRFVESVYKSLTGK